MAQTCASNSSLVATMNFFFSAIIAACLVAGRKLSYSEDKGADALSLGSFVPVAGNGFCAAADGSESHARRFLETNCTQAGAACAADSACIAYACTDSRSLSALYTTTGCTQDCSALGWQMNPSLIIQAVQDPSQPYWNDAVCYVRSAGTTVTTTFAGQGLPFCSYTTSDSGWGSNYAYTAVCSGGNVTIAFYQDHECTQALSTATNVGTFPSPYVSSNGVGPLGGNSFDCSNCTDGKLRRSGLSACSSGLMVAADRCDVGFRAGCTRADGTRILQIGESNCSASSRICGYGTCDTSNSSAAALNHTCTASGCPGYCAMTAPSLPRTQCSDDHSGLQTALAGYGATGSIPACSVLTTYCSHVIYAEVVSYYCAQTCGAAPCASTTSAAR